MSQKFYSDIKKIIDTFGHQVLGVVDKHPFAYTIGLSEKYGFELVMVGLRADYASLILNAVAEHLKTAPLEMGKAYSDFANLEVKFYECDPVLVSGYTVQAREYYGHPVKVVQLVMCDRAGKFPDEEGFDHAYMDPCQPLLYRTHH